MYLSEGLIWVRYSANYATVLNAEEVALAALSIARACPEMRADLISRLTAQDAV
jgi:hypothetical protein